MPKIKIFHNILDPSQNTEEYELTTGTTIKSWTDQNQQIDEYPKVFLLNGEIALKKAQEENILNENDVVEIRRLPMGWDPLGDLEDLVNDIADEIGGALEDVVDFVGDTLDNILGGFNDFKGNLPDTKEDEAKSSPTYSVDAQGNTARLNAPIPILYGKQRFFPDLAIQPYHTYNGVYSGTGGHATTDPAWAGNDQYLNYLLVIGHGKYDIHEIRIDDTNIDNYPEIEKRVYLPGEKIKPTDANLFYVKPHIAKISEISNVECLILKASPAFVVNPAETTITHIEIDFVFPNGIYNLDDDRKVVVGSVDVRTEIRKKGTTSWIPIFGEDHVPGVSSENFLGKTIDPVRKTIKMRVLNIEAKKQYEIRFSKIISPDVVKVFVASAKFYYAEDADLAYEGLTMLAVKIKATGAISAQNSRKINVVATRKIKRWYPNRGWSDENNSSSVVWAIADALKSSYGAGLVDSQLDLQGFFELDRIISTEGYNFNGVFDRRMTVWQGINLICKAARCLVIFQGGVVKIIRNSPQNIPISLFSPQNMVKNSLSIQHNLVDDSDFDGVQIEYINGENWLSENVSASHTSAGEVDANSLANPFIFKLFGCTRKGEALSYARYKARQLFYQRTTVSFSTELDGHLCSFGDMVYISHDLLSDAITGTVLELLPNAKIRLNEPLKAGPIVKIIFRGKAGNIQQNKQFSVRARSFETSIVELVGSWSNTTDTDGNVGIIEPVSGDTLGFNFDGDLTSFAVGAENELVSEFLVKSVKPGKDKVKLSLVNYDKRVHE
jgi:sulfur carrier protein ThiS